MKIDVTKSMFMDSFKKLRPDNFSYDGLSAMYDYLVEYEESIGQEIDLDVIAICCDYREYESFKELQEDYTEIKNLDELYAQTSVILLENGGIIIQEF